MIFFADDVFRLFLTRRWCYYMAGGDGMFFELTVNQVKRALREHRRRLTELRGIYSDDHPMVAWHLQQISHLEELLRSYRSG